MGAGSAVRRRFGGRWACGFAIACALVFLGQLAGAQLAHADATWVDGPTTDFSTWDCTIFVDTNTLSLDPVAADTQLAYQGSNPTPTTGVPYYIAIVFSAGEPTLEANGKCKAQETASLQMAPPVHTALDVTASTPIVCWLNAAQFTEGCPTSAESGLNAGWYRFDPPGSPTDGGWSVADGSTLEVDVPVVTDDALSDAANKSCTSTTQGCALGDIRMWDGFGDPWEVYPTLGVTVDGAPAGASISYPSTSTIDITNGSATGLADLDTNGESGTAEVDLYTDISGAGNPPCQVMAAEKTVDSSSVSSNGQLTNPFTGLFAHTPYCWQEVFIPTGGGADVAGATQSFNTLPNPDLGLGPGVPLSLTDGIFSATLSGTINGLTASYTSTETELGLDPADGTQIGAGNTCKDPPSGSQVQQLNLTAIPSSSQTSGNLAITTDFTNLTPSTYYCYRQVINEVGGGYYAGDWINFETDSVLLLPLVPDVFDTATNSVGSSSATAVGTLDNVNIAGVATTQLGYSLFGICLLPTGVSNAAQSPVSAADSSVPIDVTMTGLQPSTGYCWRDVFQPAGGAEVDGGWLQFTTSAAPSGGGGSGGGSSGGGGGSSGGGSGGGGGPSAGASSAAPFSDLVVHGTSSSVAVGLTLGEAGSEVVVDLYVPSAQVASAAKAHSHKPKRTLIGKAERSNLPSGPISITVPLNAKGKRALHSHRHLAVTAVTTVTSTAGTTSVTKTLTLHSH